MNRKQNKARKKSELKALTQKHQLALYDELDTSSRRLVEFGKNMAALGGILYVGYTVLDRYLDAKLKTETKVSKEPGKLAALNKIILPIVAMALQQGSVILLKKAREKLIDYLEKKEANEI